MVETMLQSQQFKVKFINFIRGITKSYCLSELKVRLLGMGVITDGESNGWERKFPFFNEFKDVFQEHALWV
jgi:hypothetical protein